MCDAAALAARFAVLPADALDRAAAATPMGGVFSFDGDLLQFRPRHPFAPGTTYAFVTHTATLMITRPAVDVTPTTSVTAVYPTTGWLPLNTLRFYVHFSAPMSEGFASTAVRLRDLLTGEVLDGALLPMPPELWDRQHMRLTVLLDPGRIKRGLRPHDEAGYPLVAGRTISLTVDAGFADAAGAPLRSGFERTYVIGEPIRSHLDPYEWVVEPPQLDTREPVRVTFDRPVDHALGQRCLSIIDSVGRPVPGRGTLANGETEWTFTPSTPWTDADYSLSVAPQLEDVAGNSPTRVFDRDLDDPAHDPRPAEPIRSPL